MSDEPGRSPVVAGVPERAGSAGPGMDEMGVRRRLDEVAAGLRSLLSDSRARGDFDVITRLMEAGQAVQRALVALEGPPIAPVRAVQAARR
ncbi:MAG: hypothetical protein AB7L84_10875 [Acidimicrobiia bacterium]